MIEVLQVLSGVILRCFGSISFEFLIQALDCISFSVIVDVFREN